MPTRLPENVRYPWAEIPVEGFFFVPTLTPELFADEAADAARRLGIRHEVFAGVYEGKYGLICRRVPEPA